MGSGSSDWFWVADRDRGVAPGVAAGEHPRGLAQETSGRRDAATAGNMNAEI